MEDGLRVNSLILDSAICRFKIKRFLFYSDAWRYVANAGGQNTQASYPYTSGSGSVNKGN